MSIPSSLCISSRLWNAKYVHGLEQSKKHSTSAIRYFLHTEIPLRPWGPRGLPSGLTQGLGDVGLRRHRPRTLVVEQLRPPVALLLGKLRRILGQVRTHRHAALHARPRTKLLEPAFEVLELLDVLALRLPVHRPRVADHIGNRVLVTRQVLALVQPVVEHPVQPVHLVRETGHRISLIALGVPQTSEMPALAALRSLVGHLPDQPLHHLIFLPRRLREEFPLLFS